MQALNTKSRYWKGALRYTVENYGKIMDIAHSDDTKFIAFGNDNTKNYLYFYVEMVDTYYDYAIRNKLDIKHLVNATDRYSSYELLTHLVVNKNEIGDLRRRPISYRNKNGREKEKEKEEKEKE